MGRLNKTGVRGLICETVTDQKTGEVVERWSIDLRYRDPNGKWQRYRERLPDGTRAAAAKSRASKVNNGAVAGTLAVAEEAPKLLGEALDAIVKWAETNRPASLQSRKTQAKALKAVLGVATPLNDLSPFALEKFKSVRLKALREAAGVEEGDDDATGAASVNRGLAMLKHACGLFVEWGWMRETTGTALRKVRKLKEPEGRVRFLSPEEEHALVGALPEFVLQIVLAATLTGLRRSELVRLKKTDVDLRARELTVTKSKSGKTRRVPINDALLVVLKAAMARSKKEHVFVGPSGEPYHTDSITHAFARACAKAKITNLRFHDCRHHFATMVRRAGGDLDVVRQLLGHSHLSMTERYAHVGRAQLHDAVSKIGSDRIAQYNGQEDQKQEAEG